MSKKNELQEAVDNAGIKKDIEYIKQSVQRIETTLKNDYATKSEVVSVVKDLAVVQKILYGTLIFVSSAVGSAVIYALLAQVIRK